jgi:hypothetical protein
MVYKECKNVVMANCQGLFLDEITMNCLFKNATVTREDHMEYTIFMDGTACMDYGEEDEGDSDEFCRDEVEYGDYTRDGNTYRTYNNEGAVCHLCFSYLVNDTCECYDKDEVANMDITVR